MPLSEQQPADALQRLSPARLLAALTLLHLALRLPLLGRNLGVYTDGILQLTQFQRRDSFWPPLYTALCSLLELVGMTPVFAGRLLSAIASACVLPPLWYLTRQIGGRRAALLAVLLYSVSPVGLRWSLRAMTDMTFLAFFYAACAGLMAAWVGRKGDWWRGPAGLLTLTALAVAATLTRYQGLLLAPAILLLLLRLARQGQKSWLHGLLAQALWLALPAWLLWQRFGHVEQVADRAGAGFWQSLRNYYYLLEMFLFIVPYILTPGVFAVFIIGLLRGEERAEGAASWRRAHALLFLYAAAAVLIAQSVFQSFQSRYLLPLLPFAMAYAGRGLDWSCARLRPSVAKLLVALLLLWSAGFAFSSFWLQRQAFADFFQAGDYLREYYAETQSQAPLFTNEVYRQGMYGIKLEYAAARPARLIPELDPAGDGRPMPPGSIVALHSWSPYTGGSLAGLESLRSNLLQKYRMQLLPGGLFEANIVPMLPDVMENRPGQYSTHQNPLAWLLRYQSQSFRTELYRIDELRPATLSH